MDTYEIPRSVRRYVIERIDSVPELEVIMLLHDNPDRAWKVAEVAERVYVSPAMATALLARMVEDGVCAPIGEGDEPASAYQYRPTAERAPIIDGLAEAYRRALISLTKMIHSKPNASLREFADAFRIGKG